MWYQRANKVLRFQRYYLIALVGVVILLGIFGNQILRPLAPTCAAAPAYNADVPAELKAKLDELFKTGRLYCVTPPAGLKNLDGPVYWGTDGVNSLLFFQVHDLTGLGVLRYAYGQDFLPGPLGGPPPPGYRISDSGRSAYINEAAAGAKYFLRTQGAPADSDYAVDVRITGPAVQNTSMLGRDIWRDLDNLVRMLQGESAADRVNTTARAAIPVLPDQWTKPRRRVVAPEFADGRGNVDITKLKAAAADKPTFVQALNGPLGSGVWVTGVLTNTIPALTLVPKEGGPALRQVGDTSLWETSMTPTRIAGFAFPTLPSGVVYEAGFWQDGTKSETSAPDQHFPVVAP